MEVNPMTAGEWIPLMDYAMKMGVSLSTLRRHIKANKIQYRVENGRYLLFVERDGQVRGISAGPAVEAVVKKATAPEAVSAPSVSASNDNAYVVSQLQTKLKKAQEEIAELKTLIAYYEESLGFTKGSSRLDG